MTGRPPYTAIVLAGARSERLGGADKAMVKLAGSTLLDRVLDAVSDAAHVMVVGPTRPTDQPVEWCQEDPAGGGPLAAFSAGLSLASATDVVLLLASDLPFVKGAVPVLLDALEPGIDVALLQDANGRANYLASAWQRRAVDSQMAKIPDPSGLPMRRLLDGLTVAEVADAEGWGFDCDTPEALSIARQREGEQTHD